MVDRISNLPDELLFHILSFLPTEDVYATSFVSKRWRPLPLSVTDLHFVELRNTHLEPRVPRYSTFIKFVEAFILRRGIHQPIKTLRLQCSPCPVFLVEKWLKAAADCNAENLQISGPVLPCTIFSIKTLVVLKLKYVAFKGFSSVELPSLKALHLNDVTFVKPRHFMELLSGCLNLENLEAKHIWFDFDDPSFKFKGNLKPLSKLVRADLSPWMMKRRRTYYIVELVRKFCDADIPIFPNLIHFELILGGFVKMESVLDILNHCPQLQTFVLENAGNKVWPNTPVVPECFSSQLQTCTITKFEGAECELTFAKFVMQNSTLLGSMKIFSCPDLSDEKKAEMRIELDSCPRSSANCELLFM